ncbi:MAG: xylulokinase, partial [Candidatus Latescibacteria bacterium]|nr:xylulokinase [Candidatus Latescibacterota bacterium]
RGLGVEVKEPRATGGGARSRLWCQLQADIFGAPVATVNTSREGPAFGAALMAGVGTGMWTDLVEATDQTVDVTATTQPIDQNVETYNQLYPIYQSLYPLLKEKFAEVSALMK